jgi:hypothetical protein
MKNSTMVNSQSIQHFEPSRRDKIWDRNSLKFGRCEELSVRLGRLFHRKIHLLDEIQVWTACLAFKKDSIWMRRESFKSLIMFLFWTLSLHCLRLCCLENKQFYKVVNVWLTYWSRNLAILIKINKKQTNKDTNNLFYKKNNTNNLDWYLVIGAAVDWNTKKGGWNHGAREVCRCSTFFFLIETSRNICC